ncbi:hypothetical protein GGU11DRAFT_694005 [Lentinula aff. detonsa]|nr:hypothetical protein GGU11DRAFT_694005 [Lentinula aff. detonsa]
MCWGFGKRVYRVFPASTKDADLERNMVTSLNSVPLKSMRKPVFSYRFADAYRKGCTGSLAAWITKRFRGHRVIPKNMEEILADYADKGPKNIIPAT